MMMKLMPSNFVTATGFPNLEKKNQNQWRAFLDEKGGHPYTV
jgi:hypothetical protein